MICLLVLTFPALNLGVPISGKRNEKERTGCSQDGFINCHQLMSASDRAGEFIFSPLPALTSWALNTSRSWPRPLVYSMVSLHNSVKAI